MQKTIEITNPATNLPIGSVVQSTISDVDAAVASCSSALHGWSVLTTLKSRANLALRLHSLIASNSPALAALIVAENGKNLSEALADVAKGLETVAYAASLASNPVAMGSVLPVSRGVACEDRCVPLLAWGRRGGRSVQFPRDGAAVDGSDRADRGELRCP